MTHRDVAVNLSVDQENRNFRRGNRGHRRDLFKVEPIFPAGIKKSDFDNGSQECSPKPWSGMKELPHAIIADFSKIGERRLRSHRAEERIAAKRLQELSSTHGFAETEDALRMLVC